ncbi:hypothetical protein [Maritalea sp.]|uniref:hypothetical protein n=1 Tax=Maritalea sp. TaxID=2003361 RepID=UPI003EF99B74
MKITMLSILLVSLNVMPTSGYATSSIGCEGINSDAAVSILFGAGPMLNAIEVEASLGDRAISTRELDGAEKAYILQFSADQRQLSLELMDDQADQHLASVRLLRHLDDETDYLQIGILSFNGSAPVAITCFGP